MPSRKPTKRERALEALIKLTTGHGPFRAHLYKTDEGWRRNGYEFGETCKCIYICDHCDRQVILCPEHGDKTAIGNLLVSDAMPTTNQAWKRGARWPN